MRIETRPLGIRYPVLTAPMDDEAGSPLAAAVSATGDASTGGEALDVGPSVDLTRKYTGRVLANRLGRDWRGTAVLTDD